MSKLLHVMIWLCENNRLWTIRCTLICTVAYTPPKKSSRSWQRYRRESCTNFQKLYYSNYCRAIMKCSKKLPILIMRRLGAKVSKCLLTTERNLKGSLTHDLCWKRLPTFNSIQNHCEKWIFINFEYVQLHIIEWMKNYSLIFRLTSVHALKELWFTESY